MALEQRDIDRQARVVYVRRALKNGRLKSTKTEGSIRAVPLQAIALAALDQLILRPITSAAVPSRASQAAARLSPLHGDAIPAYQARRLAFGNEDPTLLLAAWQPV